MIAKLKEFFDGLMKRAWINDPIVWVIDNGLLVLDERSAGFESLDVEYKFVARCIGLGLGPMDFKVTSNFLVKDPIKSVNSIKR